HGRDNTTHTGNSDRSKYTRNHRRRKNNRHHQLPHPYRFGCSAGHEQRKEEHVRKVPYSTITWADADRIGYHVCELDSVYRLAVRHSGIFLFAVSVVHRFLRCTEWSRESIADIGW